MKSPANKVDRVQGAKEPEFLFRNLFTVGVNPASAAVAFQLRLCLFFVAFQAQRASLFLSIHSGIN